jgi:hypothetical protein
MPNDLIRYDLLVQEALCGVVKKVLGDAARHGLPGEHHFYITFRTHGAGVRLSNRMRELYPEEMTIILQHQFEDLKVTDYAFEVGLSFKGIPEILLVPFDALTGFFDPSVQFSAKFEPQTDPSAEDADAPTPINALSGPRAVSLPTSISGTPKLTDVKAGKSGEPAGADKAAKPSKELVAVASDESAGEEAKVVSIDAFRKKP